MMETRPTRTEFKNAYTINPCPREEIRDFIEEHHYSKSINGVMSSHCFKVEEDGVLVAACIFGAPAMAGQWKKYTDHPSKLLELRRFVAIDNTPRNFESFCISKMLKALSTLCEVVISYADPRAGHSGVIYKALGFTYAGQVPPQRKIVVGDREYHDKAIRTKYKGELKPFAQRLKLALEQGEASYILVPGKHRFVKFLGKK